MSPKEAKIPAWESETLTFSLSVTLSKVCWHSESQFSYLKDGDSNDYFIGLLRRLSGRVSAKCWVGIKCIVDSESSKKLCLHSSIANNVYRSPTVCYLYKYPNATNLEFLRKESWSIVHSKRLWMQLVELGYILFCLLLWGDDFCMFRLVPPQQWSLRSPILRLLFSFVGGREGRGEGGREVAGKERGKSREKKKKGEGWILTPEDGAWVSASWVHVVPLLTTFAPGVTIWSLILGLGSRLTLHIAWCIFPS